MKRTIFLILIAVFAYTNCARNNYSTFSKKYPVFFSYTISDAPFNQLNTPGRFVSVKKSKQFLKVTDSDGHTTSIEMNEIQNGAFMMGLSGLIIGTPIFNNDDLSIWAYDLGCPNCDTHNSALKFDMQGIAICSSCGGNWNLNANGFATNGEFKPLYRYPVTTNRENNTLIVSN